MEHYGTITQIRLFLCISMFIGLVLWMHIVECLSMTPYNAILLNAEQAKRVHN